MLDLEAVDLEDLANALEDHSYDHSWWLDPETGEVVLWSEYFEEQGEREPEERGLIPIEPILSHEGYGDMQDFIAAVRDRGPREALERAIQGRGAFRRFKDTLLDFPQLREAWFRFHDARITRRALDWLDDQGLVDREAAKRAMPEDPDLPELGGPFDPEDIARAAADDLRRLYGARLKKTLLFGSWARGDAHSESDIDLLVVLDRVDSVWEELDRMDDVLWRHSFENDTILSAIVVGEPEFDEPQVPAVIQAKVEGRALA